MKSIIIASNESANIRANRGIIIRKISVFDLDEYNCQYFLNQILKMEDEYIIEMNLLGIVKQTSLINLSSLIHHEMGYSQWNIPIFTLEYDFPTISFNGKKDIEIKFISKSNISPKLMMNYEEIEN